MTTLTEAQPQQELRRTLDEIVNFELGHALRLYCHAHSAEGRLANVLKRFMLECSDAAMRRVDALMQRLKELTGRGSLPHFEVPPTPAAIPTSHLVHRELAQSRAAADRYASLNDWARKVDVTSAQLFERLRADHARETDRFAHLVEDLTRLD